MSIENLYKSGDFTLYEVDVTGKKEIASTLYFKGNADRCMHINKICAIEDGFVLFAGREYDTHHRASRLKTHINIASVGGVTITYAHLVELAVKEGDYVRAGEVIGYTDNSLQVMVQCRSNGRFVDGCVYLGIERKPAHFGPKDRTDKSVVCEQCGLTDTMIHYIDGYFNADGLWERLAKGIYHNNT